MDKKAEEILGSLYKQVKYRDKAVNYHAEIQIGGCAFEVYVNDLPVYKYAGTDGSGSIGLSAPINTNILKSGIQSWELRVFPPVINGKSLTTLPEGVKIDLSIEILKFKGENVKYINPNPLSLIQTPFKEKAGRQIYEDSDKPFMIYKGTFSAEVPYNLKGWSESVDLTNEDEEILKKDLVKEYEKFRNLITKRALGEIAFSLLTSEKETAQSLFYDKEMNDLFLKKFFDNWGHQGLTMYPIENYKMVFSGSGKIVTLERIDHLYDPPLAGWYIFKKDNKEFNRLKTFYLNFHRPKKGSPLEIIR